MAPKKLTLIHGGRDALEASLAQALFKPDTAEINRISNQINAISLNHPSKLTLVKIPVLTKGDFKS